MKNAEVALLLSQCRSELTDVQTSISNLGVASSTAPYLAKYAVIRACGAVEVSFKALIADFCSSESKSQVKNYIQLKVTRSSTNPSYNKILEMLGQFDVDWKKAFKERLESTSNKEQLFFSLQSLVDARNQFAHGGNPTLSIHDVIQHFDCACAVLEHLDFVIA